MSEIVRCVISGESANNSSGTNATDIEVMNAFANGSIFSPWDKQLQHLLAIGSVLKGFAQFQMNKHGKLNSLRPTILGA